MKNNRISSYLVFGLLLLTFSLKCWNVWLPLIGHKFVATLMTGCRYALLLACTSFCLVAYRNHGVSKEYRWGILLFLVYTIFLYYQIIVNPLIPLLYLQHAPLTAIDIAFSTLVIIMMGYISNYCNKYINYLSFCRLSVGVIVIFLVLYFSIIDYRLYGLGLITPKFEYESMLPDNFIDPLRLSSYIGFMAVCVLSIWDKWVKNRKASIWISSILLLSCLLLLFLIGERGPTLFLLITSVFVLHARGVLQKSVFKWTLLTLCVVGISQLMPFDLLSSLAPESMDKFNNTMEGGASNRFGHGDAIYNLSISQILDSPWLGSYFRILSSNRIGVYPHNIILEFLMTFGVIFTIPTLCLIFKALIKSYKMIMKNNPYSFWAIFFIYTFLCRMTSGTIVSDLFFWVPFFFVLSINQNKSSLYGIPSC